MQSHQQRPVTGHLFRRTISFAIPRPLRRRWLRFRWLTGPLPADWWPEFERDFRAYCGTAAGRPRRTETDR